MLSAALRNGVEHAREVLLERVRLRLRVHLYHRLAQHDEARQLGRVAERLPH